MLRKDLIQRQFEEFGKVLALILGYKRDSDWEKFQKEIDAAAKKFTDLEMLTVEQLNEADFAQQVTLNTGFTQEQKRILGELLFEKMNYYAAINDQENYLNLKRKCLALYQHVRDNFTENEFNLDVHYKLAFLSKIED